MTELRFFDGQLNPLLRTDRMISLNITKKYRGFGNVEIHFPLSFGEVITLADSHKCLICTTPHVTAVITGWRLGEDIALFGRTAEWLLTKRFLPPFSLTATPVDLARYALEQGAGDFVTVAEFDGEMTEGEYGYDELTSVYDVVMDAMKGENLGFSLDADVNSKGFVFKIYEGCDNNLLLSQSAGTACEICCTADRQNSATASGWYLRELEDMGNWNPAVNHPKLTDGDGDNCFKYYIVSRDGERFGITFTQGSYIYCDSSDGKLKVSDSIPKPVWDYIPPPQGSGAEIWDGVLDGKGYKPQAAAEELKSLTERVEAEALLRHTEYGKDYKLGDKVRIQGRWGSFSQTVKKTVVSVDIFHDTDGSGTCPTME